MLAPKTVTEIQQLLAEKAISQRQIARRLGVSRGTVRAIAAGKRPDYEAMRRAADDACEAPSGPAVRCSGCGGMVYMPCQLCHMRKTAAKKPRSTLLDWTIRPEGFVGMDLRPDHRARYEEVHARRRAQGDLEDDALLAASSTAIQ